MTAMIVAPQPEAVEAGALVLKRGGNAVDAAIACAFMQGVVDPQMAGIGGFGSMHVYMSGGAHEILEFYARAPLAATPDMWRDLLVGQSRDGFAFLLKGGASEIGYLAACTPGSVKGYATALERYGTFEWADVIRPAIAMAKRGFMVRPHVHWFWTQDQSATGQVNTIDKLRFSKTGRDIYFRPDGAVKRPGDIVVNADLARTLERLASAGPDIFYRGEIADEIAADMAAQGGLIGKDDLAKYELSVARPLWGEYRGYRIATSPPPGSGLSMLQLLHILDHFDIGAMEHGSADHIVLLAEAMKRMTIDKDRHLGDPDLCRRAREAAPVARLLRYAGAADQARRACRGREAGRQQLARHDACVRHRRPGQCGRADAHARQPVRCDYRGPRLHVQRHDEPLRSAARTRRLDRARQATRELGCTDHRLQGRSPVDRHGRAGRQLHRALDGAGPDECDRFRHEHVGRGSGAAHRRGLEHDRRLQPYSILRHRRDLRVEGIRSSVRRRATPSPRCTEFASQARVSKAARIPSVTGWRWR